MFLRLPFGASALRFACSALVGGMLLGVNGILLLLLSMHEPSTVPGRVEGGGQPVSSCYLFISSFPFLLAFEVGA